MRIGAAKRAVNLVHAEPLEYRRLLTAAPLVLTGGSGNNTFYLREDADRQNLDIWINAPTPGAGTPTQTPLLASISTITITGAGVNDSLTIDFTNGNPFPSTVAFTGGSGTTNALAVTGLGGTAVSVNSSAVVFGSTSISYASLQSIVIDGGAGNDTLIQSAQPNAVVVFNGGGGSDTLNINGGEFVLAGDPAATTSLTVNDNSALFFAGAAAGTGINVRTLTALNIGAGATATVDSPASSATDRAVLVLGSLSINATGKLDLSTNDLIVHNGSISSLTTLVGDGFDNGTWQGTAGITTSAAAAMKQMALGLELNSNPATHGVLTSTFDNQNVTATDVLIKFTELGDANLDGQVDGSDYTLIDNGFNTKATGWHSGDFNYDGVVDGSDYTLVDNEFNTQGPPTSSLLYQLENALDVAQEESIKTVGEIGSSSNYPQYTNPNGSWSWVPATQWTAGFLPGTLWELYQATGNPYYLTEATQFTNPLSVDDKSVTDVGFQVYDSFYPLLQQNPSNAAGIKQIMLAAAASKATQYNAKVGAFEAWRTSTSGNPLANFNVLMDLIMDSNLLFWAAQNTTGTLSQTYYNEAVQNAVTEKNYLVRADGGSAQFAYFNSTTGDFIDNETYEGYSATSTWSRGEAWGIYGFTLCAQDTDPTGQTDKYGFIATAEKMADYFIANLPADNVPYWDFNDPDIPNTYRDSSAAAVAASGLLNLSKLIAATDPTDSARYRSAAASILASLASPAYMNSATAAANGLLLQGALNVPQTPPVGPDSSIIFGDYYFLEAVNSYIAG